MMDAAGYPGKKLPEPGDRDAGVQQAGVPGCQTVLVQQHQGTQFTRLKPAPDALGRPPSVGQRVAADVRPVEHPPGRQVRPHQRVGRHGRAQGQDACRPAFVPDAFHPFHQGHITRRMPGPAEAEQAGRRRPGGRRTLVPREEDAVAELPDEALVAAVDRVAGKTAEVDPVTSGKMPQHSPGAHRRPRLGRVRQAGSEEQQILHRTGITRCSGHGSGKEMIFGKRSRETSG